MLNIEKLDDLMLKKLLWNLFFMLVFEWLICMVFLVVFLIGSVEFKMKVKDVYYWFKILNLVDKGCWIFNILFIKFILNF